MKLTCPWYICITGTVGADESVGVRAEPCSSEALRLVAQLPPGPGHGTAASGTAGRLPATQQSARQGGRLGRGCELSGYCALESGALHTRFIRGLPSPS